jgi:hypothetical protein
MHNYSNGIYLAELRKFTNGKILQFIQNLVDILGDVFLETYWPRDMCVCVCVCCFSDNMYLYIWYCLGIFVSSKKFWSVWSDNLQEISRSFTVSNMIFCIVFSETNPLNMGFYVLLIVLNSLLADGCLSPTFWSLCGSHCQLLKA